jgi:hypothetical protein
MLLPALYPLTRRRFLGGSTSDWPMSETTTNDVIGPIRHTPQPPPRSRYVPTPVCTAALPPVSSFAVATIPVTTSPSRPPPLPPNQNPRPPPESPADDCGDGCS